MGRGKDAAEHPALCMTDPATKNYPALTIDRAEFENPSLKHGSLRGAGLLTWGWLSQGSSQENQTENVSRLMTRPQTSPSIISGRSSHKPAYTQGEETCVGAPLPQWEECQGIYGHFFSTTESSGSQHDGKQTGLSAQGGLTSGHQLSLLQAGQPMLRHQTSSQKQLL